MNTELCGGYLLKGAHSGLAVTDNLTYLTVAAAGHCAVNLAQENTQASFAEIALPGPRTLWLLGVAMERDLREIQRSMDCYDHS